MDWFNSICGVVTLASGAAAIAQYFKIKGIRERDYNDALNIALKAQEVIAHTDDVKVAYRGTQPDVQRQLPPALQEHLFQASAILPDLIQRCGDSLNLTHHKEFDKHYQQLKDDEIIHGHLLRTIDGKRPLHYRTVF